ncbi:MAG: antibiotic biosynthesis monooxygenase [Candidatus Pacebacteria bacterium]|nr:antibiotic biosynthesis monooxygenase [Candidatus Paceibacterota bacterium]
MFVVIFRATLKDLESTGEMDNYQIAADRMRSLAFNKYGCINYFNVTQPHDNGEEEEITLSYWPNPEAIKEWRNDPEHLAAQKQGMEKWYGFYQIDVAEVMRSYSSNR